MSGLSKIAMVTSHMINLKTRLEHLVTEKDNILHEMCTLERKLWESEAALGDAERELAFVKGTAIKAIHKLGDVIRERDHLLSQCNSMQRHLLSMSRKMEKSRKQQQSHQKKHSMSPVSPSSSSSLSKPETHEDSESDSSWTVVS